MNLYYETTRVCAKTNEGVDVKIYVFLALLLMEVSDLHSPDTLRPAPMGWEAGWAPEPVWTGENFCPTGSRTPSRP
jgi:hypothetical protein